MKNNSGSVLLSVILLSLVLAIGVAAYIKYTSSGIIQVKAAEHSMNAFYIAETGLQNGMKKMVDDFQYTPEGTDPSWADGTLWTASGSQDLTQGGAISIPKDYPEFYALIGETGYQGGTYEVSISNVSGDSQKIWIRSEGTYKGATRTILSQLEIRDISPWNNAIFAGEGALGKTINGNVDIRGSVHLLGTSLDELDDAVEIDHSMFMSGAGNIGNHYKTMPTELFDRVPSIERPFGAGTAQDLEAEVRIKNGKLSLSGSAHVGQDQADAGSGYKGPILGVFLNDGYGGNQGENNVYSDNGTGNTYDSGDKVDFPKLSEPYGAYATYTDYIRANALIIDDPADLATLSSVDVSTVFSASNENGTLTMDGSGNLHASGIVLIDGPLTFTGATQDEILYTGKASILATGDITVNVDVLTKWYDTYPYDDLIGFMTPGDISFTKAQVLAMGLFYAENNIISEKQTSIAGTFISSYFDMGSNVPEIYQVPETANNLPPGMVGDEQILVVKQVFWAER